MCTTKLQRPDKLKVEQIIGSTFGPNSVVQQKPYFSNTAFNAHGSRDSARRPAFQMVENLLWMNFRRNNFRLGVYYKTSTTWQIGHRIDHRLDTDCPSVVVQHNPYFLTTVLRFKICAVNVTYPRPISLRWSYIYGMHSRPLFDTYLTDIKLFSKLFK